MFSSFIGASAFSFFVILCSSFLFVNFYDSAGVFLRAVHSERFAVYLKIKEVDENVVDLSCTAFKQFFAVIFPVVALIEINVIVPVFAVCFYSFDKLPKGAYFRIGAEDGTEIFAIQNAAFFERFKKFFGTHIVPDFTIEGEAFDVLDKELSLSKQTYKPSLLKILYVCKFLYSCLQDIKFKTKSDDPE